MADLAAAKRRLREIIKAKSLLKGNFTLASGAVSTYYLDLKPTMFDPEGAALLAEIVFAMLEGEPGIAAIGGLELGAVPIVVAVAARSWPGRPIHGFVVRKEKKGHGTDQKIDGSYRPNAPVILMEDVTTTGASVMQAVNAVRGQGGTVRKIITVVDRLEGAAANLAREGLTLVPIFTTDDLLD
jgi:orotate phosphoribosyltransferase